MLGHLISLIFRGTSIYRWNNFPRIENISETDNQAFVLHVIMLIAYFLEEKENIQINYEYIYKKILVESLITFIFSDINSDVKNRIQQKNKIIYDNLYQKGYNFLLSLNIPTKIKEDIEFIGNYKKGIFSKEYILEDNLVKFAKIFVAKQEANYNAKVYKEVYSDILQSMDERINNKDYEIFKKYLDENSLQYLDNIRRLSSNQRWNSTGRSYPVSVMSHLYIVFFFCYVLGILENLDEHDRIKLMKIGLYHDIPEAITGDILTPTKKAVEGFDELLGNIEKEMVDEYLIGIFKNTKFYKELLDLMLNPFIGEIGKIGKIADIFSALFEAKIESSNSSEYRDRYIRIKKQIALKEFKSIDYILKYGIDYFEDSIEEVISKKLSF